ncbi:hypothetical protein ACFLTS_07100, partial [Chloroflexota bacterium]
MRKLMIILSPLLLLALIFGSFGCGGDEATPTPKPTVAPTTAPTVAPTTAPTVAPTTAPTPTAKPEPVTLKLSHPYPVGHALDLSANKFKELIEEYTDGLVMIDIFPAGTLLEGGPVAFEGASLGTADL